MSTILELSTSGGSCASTGFTFTKVSWKSHTVARTFSPDALDSVFLLPCTMSASRQVSRKCSWCSTGMLYIHSVLYQQLQEAPNSRIFVPVLPGGSDLNVSLAEVLLALTQPSWSDSWFGQWQRKPQ